MDAASFLVKSVGFLSHQDVDVIRALLGFALFIFLSWLGILILKKILQKFVFKAESQHIRRMGLFFLLTMFLCAARIALLQFSIVFSFSITKTAISSIDSVIVFLSFLSLINLLDGLTTLLGERIKSAQFKESTVNIIKNILRALLWFLCLALILRIWGIEIGPLLAGLGIAGIAIGLALQTTLGDLFSGVAIAFDKEFKLGDVIEVGDVFGVVKEISARSIKVKTYSNDIVVLTNSRLSSSNLINHTALKPRRITILLRLAYGSDVKKVKKICMESIEKMAKELKKEQGKEIILSNPKPSIYMTDLAEYSINFRVFVWFPSFSEMFDAEERLKIEIYNALNRNKIRFAQQNLILPAK
jgi:small-conductance mechanosensitive channel